MSEEKENKIEEAVDQYVLENQSEIERQIRKAFLAGVELGIDLVRNYCS
jgi:hypothetical protein